MNKELMNLKIKQFYLIIRLIKSYNRMDIQFILMNQSLNQETLHDKRGLYQNRIYRLKIELRINNVKQFAVPFVLAVDYYHIYRKTIQSMKKSLNSF